MLTASNCAALITKSVSSAKKKKKQHFIPCCNSQCIHIHTLTCFLAFPGWLGLFRGYAVGGKYAVKIKISSRFFGNDPP